MSFAFNIACKPDQKIQVCIRHNRYLEQGKLGLTTQRERDMNVNLKVTKDCGRTRQEMFQSCKSSNDLGLSGKNCKK